MLLTDFIHRQAVPEPWAEGEKIPWNDPEFSRRMLLEHLSQAHDAASRRFERIERHVAWIQRVLLKGQSARILDLGCGPGFYSNRLARLGNQCVGIDFSPASVEYARELAGADQLDCTFIEGDIRKVAYGGDYDLAMLIYGEFNVFKPAEAESILHKAWAALKPGGILLLEPSTYACIQELGQRPPEWYSADGGLFSERPHLCLMENFWDEECNVTTERYWIVDAETGSVTRHASSSQAYSDAQFQALLERCGFEGVTFYPSLMGEVDPEQRHLMAVMGWKGQSE